LLGQEIANGHCQQQPGGLLRPIALYLVLAYLQPRLSQSIRVIIYLTRVTQLQVTLIIIKRLIGLGSNSNDLRTCPHYLSHSEVFSALCFSLSSTQHRLAHVSSIPLCTVGLAWNPNLIREKARWKGCLCLCFFLRSSMLFQARKYLQDQIDELLIVQYLALSFIIYLSSFGWRFFES
jgi:hypothetical protein